MSKTESHEFTTVIETLEACAKQIRIEASRINAVQALKDLDRAAVHSSLAALSSRLESYATYLEDCRILVEADEAEAQPF